jgi:hypothetical protein
VMRHVVPTLLLLAGLSALTPAMAGDGPPVVILLDEHPHMDLGEPSNTPYGGLVGQLIGKWATNSVDKQLAAEVDALKTALPAVDLQALLSDVFACVGRATTESPCVAPMVIKPTTAAEVDSAISTLQSSRLYLLQISLRFSRGWYVAVLRFHDVDRSSAQPHDLRFFAAAYATAAPQALRDGRKVNPQLLDRYFNAGTPSRLESELRASLLELRQLLDLWQAKATDGAALKDSWGSLPEVANLKSSGRIHCRGLAGVSCSGVRVLKDDGQRLWLVGQIKGRGPASVSLNEHAALYYTGLIAYMAGAPWPD